MGKNRLNLIFLHRLWRKGRSVPGIIVEPAPWELDSGAPVNETASASRAMPRRDVAVVGAGPVGLAAALALAHVGADVVLIGPVPPKLDAGPQDTRTAALLASSVDLLKALGVWQAVAPHAAPLKTMRIVDASQSLFRSPEIVFEAAELGLEAFGYNVPNAVLVERHARRVRACRCRARLRRRDGGGGTSCRRSRWQALDLPRGGGNQHARVALRSKRHRHEFPSHVTP